MYSGTVDGSIAVLIDRKGALRTVDGPAAR